VRAVEECEGVRRCDRRDGIGAKISASFGTGGSMTLAVGMLGLCASVRRDKEIELRCGRRCCSDGVDFAGLDDGNRGRGPRRM